MTILTFMKRMWITTSIASYLSAYLQWRGIFDLNPTFALIAAFLILIIGTIAGMAGLPYEIWSALTDGRSDGEEQIIKPSVIFIIWLLTTVCLSWYIGFFKAAIGGVLVLLYFTIAVKGEGTFNTSNPGIIIAGGTVHILSLLGAIVLIVHCINA